MQLITEKYTLGVDKQTGNTASAKNGNILVVSASGRNIWAPKAVKLGAEVTYKVHEVGDTFVAIADSRRTKGEVMGEQCPAGKEDEPLYFKGDKVTRTQESVEFVGFAGEQVLGFAEKAKILAELGVAVKI